MEIRYSREMNHNYMIIEAPEEETGYAVQMLSANAIEGLLKFRVRQTEEAREYYYEITSRQPLRRVLEKRTLSGQELRSILLGVLAVLKRVEEYLLKEEQLLLDPEYLYLEPDHFTVELCLVPGHREEAPQALSKLLGYLLERADHQDREAVVLAYNLYQISLRENYGTADLLRQLSGEDRIFSAEKRNEDKGDPETAGVWADRQEGLEAEQNRRDTLEFGSRKMASDTQTPAREDWKYRQEALYQQKTMKKKLEPVENSDEVEEKSERAGGKQKGQWQNRWIKVLGSAVAAGIVYWYVTGEMDVWLYAISGGIGGIVFLREMLAVRRKWQVYGGRKKNRGQGEDREESTEVDQANEAGRGGKSSRVRNGERKVIQKKKERSGIEGTLSYQDWQQTTPENRWQVYPESEEAYRQELRREEEAQIERAREAGTTLLSASKNGEGTVRLEPVEAGGTVIQISYIPFTLGKHPGLSDACIDRPTVSRLHARIDQKEGVYILTDLNSTNGTSVNGYPLQANETVSLGNGDSIYLADVGYKFWEHR
ncbi:DUF6382 domain-containing protein [Clostridium fessum]|uniref:DUF6382 domain-containing protein n=1 Tax=Clostridium fessum TaxID=2126740 RepID=UPI0022E4CE46|nr:DUF6382 domain-containing protein [Clostridium fessum]